MLVAMSNHDSGLISHASGPSGDLAAAVAAAEQRISAAGPEHGDLAALRRDLAVWQECELGRWMLCNGGWDAYWTQYCIGYDATSASDNEVEHFFLTRAPAIRATRERSAIFTGVLAELVTPGSVALSAPCGLMDDLLQLPVGDRAAALLGVDLDPAAVAGATENARQRSLLAQCLFAQGDAWDLLSADVVVGDAARYRELLSAGVDVMTSNGLNIYVPDDTRVADLYRSWRGCLRTGGHLVVSALTPPEEWDLSDVPPKDLERARGLMLINGVMWANYRSRATTVEQLAGAGFEVESVLPDSRGVFPTFVARAR